MLWLHVCTAYTWRRLVVVVVCPSVALMLRTIVRKYHFTILLVRSPLPPSSAVGIGHLKHHSKDSSSEIGLICTEGDLQAGCICKWCGGPECANNEHHIILYRLKEGLYNCAWL